jgi:DNA-directed RNA polymerase subunit RPC12/RpoP
MRNIKGACPYCGLTVKAPAVFEHREIKCPHCGEGIILELNNKEMSNKTKTIAISAAAVLLIYGGIWLSEGFESAREAFVLSISALTLAFVFIGCFVILLRLINFVIRYIAHIFAEEIENIKEKHSD